MSENSAFLAKFLARAKRPLRLASPAPLLFFVIRYLLLILPFAPFDVRRSMLDVRCFGFAALRPCDFALTSAAIHRSSLEIVNFLARHAMAIGQILRPVRNSSRIGRQMARRKKKKEKDDDSSQSLGW